MGRLPIAACVLSAIVLWAVPQDKRIPQTKSPARKPVPARAKSSMIELKSPNSKYALRFSKPAWNTPTTDGEAPWQKLEAWAEGEGWINVEDFAAEEQLTVAFPFWDASQRWSPDGQYFICITASIAPNQRLRHFINRYLDVVEGQWVSFRSGLEFASTENFEGWKPGDPHTMLVRTMKKGVLAEVLPNGQ